MKKPAATGFSIDKYASSVRSPKVSPNIFFDLNE